MPIRVYYEVLNQKGTPALYSDNYASRPAAGYQGRIFYSPDTAQIFYDTGTTWTLLADAGVGSGSLASVCANGNTTATGISITAGGLSTNSLTSTNLTAGSIPFIGTGGLFSQDNATFFWDNTNKRLGINTASPGAPLDVHGTAGVQIQLNNDTAADSKVAFLNAGVGKWRIGNLYSSGNNLFHIYNNTAGNNAMTINSANSVTFTGSVTTDGLIANSLQIIQGTTIITSGRTGIGALVNGLTIGLDSGVTQQLYFPTATAYIYTYPSATGTLINGTSFSTDYHPKYSSTTGVLTASMLTDDGTTLQSIGATRSNLYLKAANNSYYSQLAFTNGSNASYGGISYNNASQYMQIEVGTSEWLRITSTGLFSFGSTSANTDVRINVARISGRASIKATSDNSGHLILDSYDDSSNVYLQNYTTGNIICTGGGSFLIGASSTYGGRKFVIDGANSLTTYWHSSKNINGDTILTCALGGANTNNTTSYYCYFDTDNVGVRMVVYGNGNVANVNNSYGAYSDVRLKENITDATSKLDDILKVKVRNYNLIGDDRKQIGVVAQELEEIFPNMIEENENGMKGVKYSVFVPMLIKAVQELNDKIENLN